ncbi:hypothetical protein DENSPDRAFT_300783 [Dentipellis sp. KUC8613]|nr:hypothetical protein DENSPDRAFT_300783 [Dentipellis sp. KUC8613]
MELTSVLPWGVRYAPMQCPFRLNRSGRRLGGKQSWHILPPMGNLDYFSLSFPLYTSCALKDVLQVTELGRHSPLGLLSTKSLNNSPPLIDCQLQRTASGSSWLFGWNHVFLRLLKHRRLHCEFRIGLYRLCIGLGEFRVGLGEFCLGLGQVNHCVVQVCSGLGQDYPCVKLSPERESW